MKFHYTNLETCIDATGLVIVIDVIRAFTSAAFCFAGGAEKIIPVGTVGEALKIKQDNPEILACGEVGGIPPQGFDFGNSPEQILNLDLGGRTIVQRTSAGTQGIVRSANAEKMVAASYVVASATVKYVLSHKPQETTFVVTGNTFLEGGDEDQSCAEYLEALFNGKPPDTAPFLERVRNSGDAKLFYNPARPEFPELDVAHCTEIDKFNFAMPVSRENGLYVMRAVHL
jgi:2-phosphosulfolactate phosphatase